ncbi:MAG TPA: APC family permease [Opitutales bacterium]|nr:APC family permease [Opitutales bacterium]
MPKRSSVTKFVKNTVIGKERQLTEQGLFHSLSLVTLLAWVGLGADGLSSSCYGPEQAYKALVDTQGHTYYPMAVFIAAMSALTVIIISASYSQIIGVFPSGGGGYVVASRLLNPTLGVISGSALLIDYVLTISISIASAMDATFSLAPGWVHWKFVAEIGALLFMTLLNLRGVRESVMVMLPVFFIFLITHVFAVLYAFGTHSSTFVSLGSDTVSATHSATGTLGLFGMLALLLSSYSMGAGTYTGIEAVSNGMSILREPRVRTGRRTMALMALSLAGMVAGLMVAYLLVHVDVTQTGGGTKTLNAVLFESLTSSWPHPLAQGFIFVALVSSALLLVIAAQAGFLGGPPVLAAMAIDRWMPNRFAALSDRYVTLNGVVIMGGSALLILLFTHGSVELLVVLYAINVFITFSLSQLGMVRHWWQVRNTETGWKHKMAINALGLVLTTCILIVMIVQKFMAGGWVTMLMTGVLVAFAFGMRRHYDNVRAKLKNMDSILEVALLPPAPGCKDFEPTSKRTAIFLVNGFNGLGLHTLFGAARVFGGGFKKIIFVSIGVVDAGNFKGAADLENLKEHVQKQGQQYVSFVNERGGDAEAVTAIGNDVLGALEKMLPDLTAKYPNSLFFSGQLVFEEETIVTRWLHNYTAFAIQRRLFLHGLPCAIVPLRVENT